MPETHQEIKDRLLKTASALWGYKETQAENYFDPLVGILLGACATELKKIAHDIEDTRTRVLERLVQLLNPEVLSGALPAHAVACASPADKQATLHSEIQFYTTKKTSGGDEPNSSKTIFFTPTGPFTICRTHITAMATTKKVYAVKETLKKETLLHAREQAAHPYQHSIWLGLEQAASLPAEALFFFELRNEARRPQFYHALPETQWQGMETRASAKKGFGRLIPLHGKPNPEGIINGQTSATSRMAQ
ncbi:MAG: type VI secretion system baseplate subunit TssF, partial [Dinghuibacter sp.]|nr:type VI secretion system baseplate subunit TssF [Dinghuibacter sp.]